MNAVFPHFYLGLAQLTDYWLQEPIVVSGVASIEPTEAIALVKKSTTKIRCFIFLLKKFLSCSVLMEESKLYAI